MWETLQRKWMERFICYLSFLLINIFLLFNGFSLCLSAEEPYPNRSINMIVGFAPSSGAGIVSRIMADKMEEFLGQPVVSVYKAGAAGSLSASFVAKAKPDGYTVLNGSTSPNILGPIVKKLDYKMEDFIILPHYSSQAYLLAVKEDARWKTLRDFVAEAKKFPGKLSVTNSGKLSASDFLIIIFSKYAGINVTSVPFPSSGEAMTATLGGHADAVVSSGFLVPGLRGLATPERKRVEQMPDIPTFEEFGYPLEVNAHNFFCFPNGTPQKIVDRFYDAQKKAIEKYSKEISKSFFEAAKQILVNLTPEESKRILNAHRDLFYKTAKEIGIAVE